MARGVNKVILLGNLGADPEVRSMPSGNAVANASLATTQTWKDKQTGQPQELTEWHRLVFYNRLAEIAGEYLHKGSKVFVEGALRTRKWQDQSGQDRYTTEIVVAQLQMLDGRSNTPPAGQAPASQPQGGPQAPQQGRAAPAGGGYGQPPAGQSHSGQQPSSMAPAGYDSQFDDDIPF